MDNYVLGALLQSLGGIVNNVFDQFDGSGFSSLLSKLKQNRITYNQLKSSKTFGNLADRGFPSSYSRR